MARKPDIGGYFEQITRGARGGRRLDHGPTRTSNDPARADDGSHDRGDNGGSSTPAPSRGGSSGGSSGGSLKDRLRDIFVKGKEQVTKRVPTRMTERSGSPAPDSPAGGPLAPGGVVSIEYSPRMDGDPDPGDVVWVWVPFEEDPTQGKDRPLVVIGRRGSKLVGIPLTTKPDDREAQIEVGVGDWDPKRRVSYARVWRMLDIDPGEMRREGAVIDRKRFDQLVKAVDRYYDIKLPATPKPASPKPNQKRETIDYDY